MSKNAILTIKLLKIGFNVYQKLRLVNKQAID